MKKLIAISVVFALVAGVAFAVDLGGSVDAKAVLLQGNSDGGDITSGGKFGVRLEGSGESGDGKFGGWIRIDPTANGVFLGNGTVGFDDKGDLELKSFAAGIAWWKPIDQFKLSLGVNPDGMWGKEGGTAWMLNQMANNGDFVSGSSLNNIWGWGGTSDVMDRWAFYGGWDTPHLAMEIKPFDVLGINIAIPFFTGDPVVDVFKATVVQVDLNLAFGNIAFTFSGNNKMGCPGMNLYYGGSFGDLALDFGLGYHFNWDGSAVAKVPLFIGLGLKYTAGAFGIKSRIVSGIPVDNTKDFGLIVDLVPYFSFSDSVTVFLNAGIGISGKNAANLGWYVNPYLRVGAEWGPSFYVGFIAENGTGGNSVSWSLPILITVGF